MIARLFSMAGGFFGAVIWCRACQKKTAHLKTKGGWYVCRRCGSYNE